MVHAHAHLHRRGRLVLDNVDAHQHQRRDPQFWRDVEDTWNNWFGSDDEDEDENTQNRHQNADRQNGGGEPRP